MHLWGKKSQLRALQTYSTLQPKQQNNNQYLGREFEQLRKHLSETASEELEINKKQYNANAGLWAEPVLKERKIRVSRAAAKVGTAGSEICYKTRAGRSGGASLWGGC